MSHELLTRAVEKVVPQKLAEEKLASKKPIRLYLGIDPTGAKLHLGHSVPLRKLRQFADAGHEVIFLVGSFTAMIGDPTGRDQMREALGFTQVQKNFETYKQQASKVLDFSKVTVKYNHEWLGELKFQEITHLLGHFTVQQMLERDMFDKRIKEGKPIAMSEFLYPLMQAYDSAFMDVDAEIGGNDQLFNMLCGRTLQTAQNRRDKFVLTTKLIEGTDGRKMSKTFDNCIWLEDTAKDMYGKMLSIKDELITTYMECTTDIPMDEIKDVEKQMKKGANPKEFKMRLARELVTMYHSEKDAQEQEAEWTRVFSNKELPTDIPEAKAKKGALLIDVLIENGLIPSKSEARRLVEQKGITLNDETVSSTDQVVDEGLTPEALAKGVIVKVGKRKFLKISL